MYQEKVNIEQGIRPTGELLTDRSFLMPKTTKSDKNEQPEIMKDQEEFYYGIFSERSRNFTDICDRTGSRYWNLEFNQGKGVNITVRRNGRMSLTRPAAGGESCRAGFFFKKIVQKRELSFSREGTDTSTGSRQR